MDRSIPCLVSANARSRFNLQRLTGLMVFSYLLAPQLSLLGGIGATSARVVLLGTRNPHVSPNFYRDSDPIIFTEIAEFALSLAAPAKGQDPFYGFPHLQPFKLIRAVSLAELGHVQLAGR
jgi:COPII coat assembly protein SEC16